VTAADVQAHRGIETAPLSVGFGVDRLQRAPPTQGLASLIILGVFDRLGCAEVDGFSFVHDSSSRRSRRSWSATGS